MTRGLSTFTVAAFGVLTAGLAIAGCSSGSSTDASSTGSSTSPAASPAASSATTTAAAGASAEATTSLSTCKASDLSFKLGATSGSSSQKTQVVDLTNKVSFACTMSGFPGVDLVGTANGQKNYTWSLERSSAKYSRVTLQPGETAHFHLIYLPEAAGDSTDIAVTKLIITPPNAYTHAEVTWSQRILLQDGATRPGTYITPVVSGS
jgi:hypothetical protein